MCSMRDRLVVGRQVLALKTEVRVLVPQPRSENSLITECDILFVWIIYKKKSWHW